MSFFGGERGTHNTFHFSQKKKEKKRIRANITGDSRLVTHDSTNPAQTRLTSVIGREPVHSRWYERWRKKKEKQFPHKAPPRRGAVRFDNVRKKEREKGKSVFFPPRKREKTKKTSSPPLARAGFSRPFRLYGTLGGGTCAAVSSSLRAPRARCTRTNNGAALAVLSRTFCI